MILRNLDGITKDVFRIGRAPFTILIGALTGQGRAEVSDYEARTVRNLIQIGPRWLIPDGETQLATSWEVHRLADQLSLGEDSGYVLDEGAILKIDGA